MKILTCFTYLLLSATTVLGADPSGMLGIWKTEKNESKIEIFRYGEKFCGKIIWLKDPTYSDSSDGAVGTPVLDRKNPDPALQARSVLGLRVLEGFSAEGDSTLANGTCYDPKSGKTYRGKIHLAGPDRLELRGYIGIPLFGRSSVWTR